MKLQNLRAKNVRQKRNSKKNRKRSYRKNGSLSKRLIRRTIDAGLPDPTRYTKAEFAKLQQKWYAKLADNEFDDIEWVDHKTGLGHDSPHLRGSLQLGKQYHPGRELYFQMATSYLQCKNLKGYYRFIWQLHANDSTYDEIIEALKTKYLEVPSKYTVFYDIQKLAKLCYKWNCTNPNGVLVKRNEDRQKIAESHLADFIATEYNWILGEELL